MTELIQDYLNLPEVQFTMRHWIRIGVVVFLFSMAMVLFFWRDDPTPTKEDE